MSTNRKVDPITVEVVRHMITAIGDEMEADITRTAFSPIVYEFKDYCAALLDAEGRIIGQAAGGLPLFLSDLGNAVKDIFAVYDRCNIEPDDVFISNDPNVFGQHLNNVVVVLPMFFQGELIAFSAVRAHWADVGGRDHGGDSLNTTEIFQEGLQIPTVKIYKKGILDDELMRMITLNIREPEAIMGDMRAQVTACHQGARRYVGMVEKYGYDVVSECIRIIWDQSEERIRRNILSMPDGVYSAESYIDCDGVRQDVQVPLKVRVIISGSDITVDFSDISDQTQGPLNTCAPAAMTVAQIAVKMVAGPVDPTNEGSFRPVHIILPEGKMLSARRPAPMAWWSATLASIVDTVLAALSQAIPELVPAGSRQDIGGVRIFSAPNDPEPFHHIQSGPGGWGAFPNRDGICGMLSYTHGDSRNLPAEIVESTDPILIEQSAIVTDSGGAGKFRGGVGVTRSSRMRRDAIGSFTMHRTLSPPWGLYGGLPGRPDMFRFEIPGNEDFSISRIADVSLTKDSVVHMDVAGGGGWGDPLERDPKAVANDVENGYVSVEAARDTYGVILEGFTVDDDATETQRVHLRQSR